MVEYYADIDEHGNYYGDVCENCKEKAKDCECCVDCAEHISQCLCVEQIRMRDRDDIDVYRQEVDPLMLTPIDPLMEDEEYFGNGFCSNCEQMLDDCDCMRSQLKR